MKEVYIQDIKALIGSNAKENWNILDLANPDDVFFHLSSFPSCYLILESEGIPEYETINESALCCKNNTKYRNVPNIKVDYTLCSNVIKGTKVGEVIYKSNKKVFQIKI